jgi:hypothetical protein
MSSISAAPPRLYPAPSPQDESGEVVYESSLISVSQDVKTVTG